MIPYFKNDWLTLYNCDCLEVIPSSNVDLIITSPPYYTLKQYETDLPYSSRETYLTWIEDILVRMKRSIKPNGCVIIVIGVYAEFCSIWHLPAEMYHIARKIGLNLVNELIWEKPKGTQGLWTRSMSAWLKYKTDQPMFAIQHEYIQIYNQGERKKFSRRPEEFIKRVAWSIQSHKVSKRRGHPCPLPVKLVEDLIICYSNSGDVVLDPFVGSGTVALGCKLTKRKCVAIDISAKYCEDTLQLVQSNIF